MCKTIHSYSLNKYKFSSKESPIGITYKPILLLYVLYSFGRRTLSNKLLNPHSVLYLVYWYSEVPKRPVECSRLSPSCSHDDHTAVTLWASARPKCMS